MSLSVEDYNDVAAADENAVYTMFACVWVCVKVLEVSELRCVLRVARCVAD